MKSTQISFWILLAGFFFTGCATATTATPPPAAAEMPAPTPTAQEKVSAVLEFIGHSSFLLTASDGTRIVMDPYKDFTAPREIQMYPEGISADAVVISHFHPDHTNSEAVAGARVIYQPGTDSAGIVRLTGLAGDHGLVNGAPNGANTVWVFEIGPIKIVHTGANGVVTQPEILAVIENADVVLLRVGGDPAHPVKEMVDQIRSLKARTIVPSHFSMSTEYRFFSTLTVDEFLDQIGTGETIVRADGSKLEVNAGMPEQVVVLKPSALASQ
jgi:L-ascorbate metabolism protein UlaG (beta-lactamase superfamily)